MSSIPILILIDCEPDGREPPVDAKLPWAGFERFFDFLAARRSSLASHSGREVRFNWFWRMDPQVETIYGRPDWAAIAYADQFAASARAGDSIGLHAHAWRWDPPLGRWIVDYGNASWVEHCVRRSFDAYRSAFGRDCTLFRFGDGWFDCALIPLLEQLGARIDLTIEPGGGPRARMLPHERTTGRLPDRRHAPRLPYHPARHDFCRRDKSGVTRLWEFPVSTCARTSAPSRRALCARCWRGARRDDAYCISA